MATINSQRVGADDETPVDDLLVIEPARPVLIKRIYDRLALEGSFARLSSWPPDTDAKVALAHFHYGCFT